MRGAGNTIVVGISEYAISNQQDAVLTTYSLGSCVGLSLYDPARNLGGMLHAMLPLSSAEPEKAKSRPAAYVDSGVAALLTDMFACGSRRQDLVATVAGAASRTAQSDIFRIGERNYTIMRRMLWRNGILITAENVGGSSSRTMCLDMSSGKTYLRIDNREYELQTDDQDCRGGRRCL